MRRTGILALAILLAASAASALTYSVTSTADTGAGTLRQAILDANANPGADSIAFGIVGSGVHTIAPASALPAVTGPVVIDGYTQAGSSANTNSTGQGLNTVLRIEIDGTTAGGTPCLSVTADDVTIRGLAINRCTSWAIQTYDNHQHLVVEGCFFGTTADGTQGLSPYFGAVFVQGHQNARIGGTTPASRNLMSGLNGANHVYLANFSPALTTGTLVAGNLIGTDITGHLKMNNVTRGQMAAFLVNTFGLP